MSNPLVTVLMPVYNGEKYLREAIESILKQTFTDFEFLIINDGSTDSSKEIILNYDDKRIRYVENEKNIKLIDTLNKGISLARGMYIARMDCDDISLPKRLEKQVKFMEQNPEIGICGTWVKTFGENIKSTVWKYPIDYNAIKSNLLFNSLLAHPSVMFRLSVINDNKLRYNSEFKHAEDYALWVEAISYTKIVNIPKCLLDYRIHNEQVTKKYANIKVESANKVRASMLLKIMPDATKEEINFHLLLASNLYNKSHIDLSKVLSWFSKLLQSNKETKYLNEKAFKKVLSEIFVEICIANRNITMWFKTLAGSLFDRNSLSFISIKKHTIKMLFDSLKNSIVKNV